VPRYKKIGNAANLQRFVHSSQQKIAIQRMSLEVYIATAKNEKSFAVLKDHFFVDNSFILLLDLAVAFPICREGNLSLFVYPFIEMVDSDEAVAATTPK
jgi:hypothetical protein